jgi:hypothetical protein
MWTLSLSALSLKNYLLSLQNNIIGSTVTEQGVTEQVIVDHCCSVNANFIFEGLRVKPVVNFWKERWGL